MSINIIDIAERAGVSTATVSRALNQNGSVRTETRQRILQIASELNYKPNPIARSLSRKKTDTIGVILPELVDEFFMEIIRGIDEEAYQSSRYIMVSSSHSQRNIVETLLEFMSSGRVDGVILMAPQLHNDTLDIIQKSKKPVVLVNICREMKNVVSYNINNYQGARSITEHLIKHGYRKIGMITGPQSNCDAEERYRGFKDALQQNNLQVNEKFIVQGDFSVKSGYYGFVRLMSQQDRPEAIFAANDMMAVGLYEAARESEIRIPEDVAVAGFDDIYLSRLLLPRLTTAHVPISELGSKATRHLFRMISNENDANTPFREELSTGLVIGSSCGCNNRSTRNFI